MNTYLPYQQVIEEYTYPGAPDTGTQSAVLSYGGEILSTVTPSVVAGNKFSATFNDDIFGSAGTYDIKWICDLGGDPFYDYTSISIQDLYVDQETFFDDFPEYNSGEYQSRFEQAELLARRIIDTYTGQDFQFIKDKTLTFEGRGKDTLYVTNRLNSFSSVLIGDADYTSSCTLDVRSRYFIKIKSDGTTTYSKFPDGYEVAVTGDWGWRSVPWEIKQATELLVVDILDDVRRETYKYGISRLWQDTNRIEIDKSIYNSTGNLDVDTLLMDFVIWTMDYVT